MTHKDAIRIEKYAGFFHDGSVEKIIHKNNKIEIWMESAELQSGWNDDNIPLSKHNTLAGKLFLENIQRILIEGKESLEKFRIKKDYDKANINDFEMHLERISLTIWWVKYLPKYEESDFFFYEIEAKKIFWENIPTLFDDSSDSV